MILLLQKQQYRPRLLQMSPSLSTVYCAAQGYAEQHQTFENFLADLLLHLQQVKTRVIRPSFAFSVPGIRERLTRTDGPSFGFLGNDWPSFGFVGTAWPSFGSLGVHPDSSRCCPSVSSEATAAAPVVPEGTVLSGRRIRIPQNWAWERDDTIGPGTPKKLSCLNWALLVGTVPRVAVGHSADSLAADADNTLLNLTGSIKLSVFEVLPVSTELLC